MDTIQIKAALAGVFFGLWPLFMQRSGFSGNVSSMILTFVVVACVSPFAIQNIVGGAENFAHVSWVMVIAAGITSAIGLLLFNSMLSQATTQSVATLFVIMIVVQTTIPAIQSAVVNGGISPTKAAGFAFAGIAAVLLTRA